MNTIGQVIKSARVKKKLSLKKLEEITKIKASFIDNIELENWGALPTFTTVLGFVKSLSTALKIDPVVMVAILKRDYPPKKINITPKPDVFSKFTWSPKLTFIVGIVLVLFVILGYLGFQYIKFVSPPELNVDSPKENQVVTTNSVTVFGSTDSDVKITVNNQPVLVDDDGNFSVNIGISSTTKEIDIIATSRSGKINEVKRKIVVN